MKKFTVRICYSGYCTYSIEAENEDDAWKQANLREIDPEDKEVLYDLLDSLERWKDADMIEKEEENGDDEEE